MSKLDRILEKMTLEAKVDLCLGASYWRTKAMPEYDIPAVLMCDGPHGLRLQEEGADMLGINDSVPATCFPTAVSSACSWDTALIAKMSEAIAKEAIALDVDLVLGPGVNIKRNPLCGRNFEYFSEDPVLAGKLAAEFIRTMEGLGVGTSLKHFACNNQEYKRFSSSSELDERTLREIYLRPFEIAVKEGKPSTVMSAYNKINGEYCSDSRTLLTSILREEWGFDGLVVTDWGAMNDRIRGTAAGCDLIMPGGSRYMTKEVLAAVEDGRLSEAAVDSCARRIIAFALRANQEREALAIDQAEHHALARQVAVESAVLLKNDGLLPLKGATTALIGFMAQKLRYQGAGSSHINPTRLPSLVEAMPEASYAEGCAEDGSTTERLIADAVQVAKSAEQVVVVAGLTAQYESEGFDRENMKMPPGHLQMIEAVAEANPNTVVVLLCGSVVEVPWADKVRAILYMGLPGQAGGEAIPDLLFGRKNPCGKLAETWPLRYEDCPSSAYYGGEFQNAQYREGVYVGYRYYETAGVPVRWCFGHGLSYTEFAYSELKVKGQTVELTVKNTGDVAGAEIVQLYVAPPQDGIYRPVKELKGFEKIFLEPGESKKVRIELDDRSFAVWDKGWRTPAGTYRLMVGASVRDIRLETTIEVEGEKHRVPDWQAGSWYKNPEGTPSEAEWKAMLGREAERASLKKGEFTMSNSVAELRPYSFAMRLIYGVIERTIAKRFEGKRDYANPTFRMLLASSADASLSAMEISGGLKPGLMAGALDMANGRYLRGIKRMLFN